MKRAVVLLVYVVGCQFDLPEVGLTAKGCPTEYAPLVGAPAGHVYQRAPSSLSWVQQFVYCRSRSDRTYLAVPNDATELMNLYMLAGAPFWVGIHDQRIEGTYVDVASGLPATFLPWAPGEPDNLGSLGTGNGDCVASTTDFFDDSCAIPRQAVCECAP
ncbi:MAG TPA: C-type lectin domain-containing protein [Kofleriaceae bacterium]|nr:C-type lectin domain-containing protein [Kofleriaceae bacterium]